MMSIRNVSSGRRIAWVTIAVLSGCQTLTGLSDFERASELTTTSSAGSGGQGGGGGDGDGAGGGGTAGAGGDGGAGGPAGAGGGGGPMCPMLPPPDMCAGPGPTPMVCDGMCTGSTCRVICEAPNGEDCDNPVGDIACGTPTSPHACVIECNGTDSCKGKSIRCHHPKRCEVFCSGSEACLGATITCSQAGAPCSLSCEGDACDETTQLNCGTGPCDASCTGGASLTVQENQSCMPNNGC